MASFRILNHFLFQNMHNVRINEILLNERELKITIWLHTVSGPALGLLKHALKWLVKTDVLFKSVLPFLMVGSSASDKGSLQCKLRNTASLFTVLARLLNEELLSEKPLLERYANLEEWADAQWRAGVWRRHPAIIL